jgi:AraC-like DNA-binding protein
MGVNGDIVRIETIADIYAYYGKEPLSDYIAVIDMSKNDNPRPRKVFFDIYCIICVFDDLDSNRAAHLNFLAPGSELIFKPHWSMCVRGWMLCFHPSLMQGTLLANRISDYVFFVNKSQEQIYINEVERALLISCMQSLNFELQNPFDKYSKRVMAGGVMVLLTQCLRFYDRVNSEDRLRHSDILRHVDLLLNCLYSSTRTPDQLPTVAWCAEKLNMSANYFGDLMRKHGSMSAQQYIHQRIINEVKVRLESGDMPINEIAYSMGFKHPHHLSRMFSKIVGCTPREYRLRQRSVGLSSKTTE